MSSTRVKPSRSRARLFSRTRLIAAGACAGLVFAGIPLTAAQAEPEIAGAGHFSYTEQEPAITVGSGVTIHSSGSSYGGGYVDFDLGDGAEAETLSLRTDSAPATASGVVSVVGNAVYLGDGTSAQPVGSVDPVKDGEEGQPLRVNFTTPFENPGFESPQTTGGMPIGWHALKQWIDLGVTQIPPGHTSIDTSTYPAFSQGDPNRKDNVAPQSNMTYDVQVQTAEKSEGSSSLRLYSSGTSTGGCDVVHGPAVYSDPFEAAAGDHIYFDWAAMNGGDWYDVFGYLYNEDTGAQTPVIDSYGNVQSWTTKDTEIPADGHYRFVFVSGTFDESCGRATGASLYIDNVRVYGSKVKDTVVQDVARRLQYHNGSDNPPAQRTIAVTAVDSEGDASGAGAGSTATIDITPVDDPPTVAIPTAISYQNTEGATGFATRTGQLDAADPDDTILYQLQGGKRENATVDGIAYDRAVSGRYGTLRLNSGTGQYVFVPAASLNAVQRSGDETYTFIVGSSAHPGVSVGAVLRVDVDVVDGPPGAPAGVTAVAGKQSAQLSWSAPAWIGNAPVTGYAVEGSADGGATWNTVVADTGSTATTFSVTGLAGGSELSYRVRAINANGIGDASAGASITPYDIPGAPAGVTVAPGARTASVSWSAPSADNGSAITRYRVQQLSHGAWVTVGTTGPSTLTTTVTDLANGTTAVFRVIAENAAGAGAPSDTASTTPRTTPGPVRDLTAAPADGAVLLDWTAPGDDGGAAIAGYDVSGSVDGGRTWTPVGPTTDQTMTVTGLTNGQPIAFRVVARNEAGAGTAAETADVAARTTPGAPTITGITTGNRTVTISITPPSNTGGAAITGYEYTIDGGATWSPAGDSSPLVIRGLANGQSYSIGVRASNPAGGGNAAGTQGQPVLTPVTAADGSPLAIGAGGPELLVDGIARAVTVDTADKQVRVSGAGFTFQAASLDSDGHRRGLDTLGRLVLTADGSIQASGSGYRPGSTVDVWLVRTNTLLGQVEVKADGIFAATFAVPAGTPLGAATAQFNGESPSGELRSLSLGVVVATAEVAPTLASTGSSTSSEWWVFAGLLLLGGAAAIVLGARAPRRRTR